MFPGNALYNPSGYNDNNFNRKSMPSNIFPMNGGMSGNYVGQFNPLTTNTQYNMKLNSSSNFDNAFMQQEPIIGKIDYTNKNNIIHNNIGDNVLDEHVVEYRLIFDSADRDIKYYPNPFDYTVKFNPASSSTIQCEEYVNPKNKTYGTKFVNSKFEGDPNPVILREFKNVKYIKLENIILPQYSQIKKDKCGEYEFDPNSSLIRDRYVNLTIKELNADRVFTTFDDITRFKDDDKAYTPPTPFSIIIPDKILGNHFYTGIPYYGSKIYKNSLLGNLTQMTVKLYDCEGLPLGYNKMFTYEQLEEYECENGFPLPKTDLRHPYNKQTQTFLSLIIGVVESQINTNTKFDQ